jgi:hypothetical protein
MRAIHSTIVWSIHHWNGNQRSQCLIICASSLIVCPFLFSFSCYLCCFSSQLHVSQQQAIVVALPMLSYFLPPYLAFSTYKYIQDGGRLAARRLSRNVCAKRDLCQQECFLTVFVVDADWF